jgi:glycosyltransferase involved in cell wall biosynthesis
MAIRASEWPSLAVVLPALNEEAHLASTLRSLLSQANPAERVLVVDGGSADRTEKLARSLGADVLSAPGRGRGGQIAEGVLRVCEDVVLVAHADMLFPPGALEAVRRHLADRPACPGGCLGHRFDSGRWVFRVVEWFDRRRAQRGDSYGDQAQFFRREALARIGGFPDQPIMEDVELSRRLRLLGQRAYLDFPVTVSPRRFERRGLFHVLRANAACRRAYRRGGLSACEAIYRAYYRE